MTMLPYDIPGLRALFEGLETMEIGQLEGTYEARLLGPLLVRDVAPFGMAAAGLRGWWGKAFDGSGRGDNIVRRGQRFERTLPMKVVTGSSLVDGRSTIRIEYGGDAPLPWRKVVDEPRILEPGRLLCMAVVRLPGLSKVPAPFLLERNEIDV